jgi:hypothetical protein
MESGYRAAGLQVRRKWSSRHVISLPAVSTRRIEETACPRTISERKSLRLESHCFRQRLTRHRYQGSADLVSTNRPAAQLAKIASKRLGSRGFAPSRYSSMQFRKPQDSGVANPNRKAVVQASLIHRLICMALSNSYLLSAPMLDSETTRSMIELIRRIAICLMKLCQTPFGDHDTFR